MLLSGKASQDHVRDMGALNKYLGAPKKNLAVYDRLKAENRLDEKLKDAMVRDIAELLVEAKRYPDLIDAAGDAERRAAEQRCKARPKEISGGNEEMLKTMREMDPPSRRWT